MKHIVRYYQAKKQTNKQVTKQTNKQIKQNKAKTNKQHKKTQVLNVEISQIYFFQRSC